MSASLFLQLLTKICKLNENFVAFGKMVLLTKQHHECDKTFSAIVSKFAATDDLEVVSNAFASGANRRDRCMQFSLLDNTMQPRNNSYSVILLFFVNVLLSFILFLYTNDRCLLRQ